MVDSSLVFRIVNIVAAALMIVGAISLIIGGGFPNFILAVFCILFGVIVVLFEFRLHRAITKLASFLFSFLGRGLLYIFIGCIMLNYFTLSIVCGAFNIVIGAFYIIFHFTPQVEAPSNMKWSTFENTVGMASTASPYHTAPPDTTPTSYHPSSSSVHYQTSPTPATNYNDPYAMPATAYPQKTYLPDEAHV
ncbi:hypothetical protein DM01DRAFT_1405470 [Hesseltinella vesiculosa]|uniref:COPI associated n=1 Tax=Hesseltinella vesiculosa TaxID=101127 RepID=A0A1X2GPV1_9FUNG|nr:hypothetical protein DM01DRAFT_1405470 [Hesseltinella vesiculosa]